MLRQNSSRPALTKEKIMPEKDDKKSALQPTKNETAQQNTQVCPRGEVRECPTQKNNAAESDCRESPTSCAKNFEENAVRKAKCAVQEGKESVNSTDGIPDKIGFPQKTLFDRPTRLDVLCAKKGLFAAISKPADTLFEPYSGSPAMPHEVTEPYEMQYAPIVAAIRKQAGKPELERLGIKSPFCALQCDYEVSGACVVACDKSTAAVLRNAEGSGYVAYEFILLARKSQNLPKNFEVNLPIVKNENRRVWTVSHRYGKKCRTAFELAEDFRDFQLWRARSASARPHQIRLHAAEKGLKIIGESVYSRGGQIFTSQFKGSYKLKRGEKFEKPIYPHLFLHLQKVSFNGSDFNHPELGANEICAPLPKNFALVIDKLGNA